MDDLRPAPATTTATQPAGNSTLAPGAEKAIGVIAAVLVTIGFFAPDAQAQSSSFFGGATEISFNLTQAGFAGIFILLIGIALGLAPFYLQRRKRSDVMAFGLSCGIFGTLAIAWFAALSLPAMISTIGHLAFGFYALLVGYFLNVYVMSKRVLVD